MGNHHSNDMRGERRFAHMLIINKICAYILYLGSLPHAIATPLANRKLTQATVAGKAALHRAGRRASVIVVHVSVVACLCGLAHAVTTSLASAWRHGKEHKAQR
jgi:hypothetical protein